MNVISKANLTLVGGGDRPNPCPVPDFPAPFPFPSPWPFPIPDPFPNPDPEPCPDAW